MSLVTAGQLNDETFEALKRFDTPTICNALEMVDPARRGFGYTDASLHCINGRAGPVAGVAFTGTVRSEWPPIESSDEIKQHRIRYYEYMNRSVGVPKICVMQDLDGPRAGRGAFWGEFNTRIHRALGFCAVVTDGSMRDVRNLPSDVLLLSRGLRPSHAHIHVVSYDVQVNVFGMSVAPGDVVHADEHGAVTFSQSLVESVMQAAEDFIIGERPILEACKSGDLDISKLRQLYLSRTR